MTSGAPDYVIADQFFQGAYGGSYLNHQYLIAAQPLEWPNPPTAQARRSTTRLGIVHAYPLLKPAGTVVDGNVTQACGLAHDAARAGLWRLGGQHAPADVGAAGQLRRRRAADRQPGGGLEHRRPDQRRRCQLGLVCGRLGQRRGQRRRTRLDKWLRPDVQRSERTPPRTAKTWPFCPDSSFQFHHQPFNYFLRYAPGTIDRVEAPEGRGRIPRRGEVRPSAAGELRQAARQREQAPPAIRASRTAATTSST